MVHKKGVEQKMVSKKKCVRADNRNLFRVSMFPIVGLFIFRKQKMCYAFHHYIGAVPVNGIRSGERPTDPKRGESEGGDLSFCL